MIVDCRGREAHVEVVGEGPPVVYVGTAVPMAWTRPSALALAELGHRVINFDYGSAHPSPRARTALSQVDDVVAVMDHVGVKKGLAIGLSRGAMTAYGLASRHPERISALALVLPVAGWSDTLHVVDDEPSGDGEGDLDGVLATIFSAGFLADRRHDAAALITTPPGSVARVDRFDEEPFASDERADVPMLVVEGGADQVVDASHPARYLREHPEAVHIVVSGATHGWPMEQPSEFARIVADFASGL